MYNLSSIFIGFCIAVMIVLNGALSETVGNYTSSIIIHCIGLVVVILIMLMTKKPFKFYNQTPWYLYIAGAIGVSTILFNNISFQALGVSLPLALGLFGQTITSIIMDQYGIMGTPKHPFNKKKSLGLFFIVVGLCIMIFY